MKTHLDLAQFSIFALGVMPLLTSFVTVEVFASIIRPWRKLRDTVAGRRKLGLAVAITAVVISAVQAYFVVTYLESMSRGGAEVFDPKMFWPCAATLAAGPMLLAVLASTISTRGLGNGYAVMFVAAWLWSIPWFDLTANAQLALTAAIVVATVAITLGVLGWRVRAPGRVAVPLPASSIAPIHDGGGAIALIGTLSALGVTLPYWILDKAATLHGSLTIGLVVLAIAAVFWAFVFARPGRRRAELAAAKQEPADRALWVRALAITIGALAALFTLALIRPAGILGKLCDPAIVVIAAATIADLVAEARAYRQPNLVPVWPLHDPLLVDAARDVLGDIPHVIQATRLRTLLWMFGAYVPMVVLVPEPQSAEAHAKLRDWLTAG
jgi:preprotein translocase subunit SecY